MNDRFLLLQLFSKFLDYMRIDLPFQSPPPLDQSFWDEMTQCIQDEDRKTLEAIAAILRSGVHDFYCTDRIRDLLHIRGFDVGAFHDF